ncbi:MAG: protein-L-isoaspartate O-methyltransferase [Spirochaetales bacterium]|nr:MAG: protein-L-isoaspartate O-methyltransferase [Spirochaetales bacterium]
MLNEADDELFTKHISLLEDQIVNHFPDAAKAGEIMAALRKIPRHLFVDPAYRYLAYTDNAIPTCNGLTTSAPSVIAECIFQSGAGKGWKILEIGTGSGYEAAVLAAMGCRVFSVEMDTRLYSWARRVLSDLGYGSVMLFNKNGKAGCAEHSPFHAILVAASVPNLDSVKPLSIQLYEGGGRLVVPVGGRQAQELCIIVRHGKEFQVLRQEDVSYSFVRLTG